MDINWGIFGHKQQLDLLGSAISKKRLAHGYLFTGPEGVGKFTVAKKFAQALLCLENSACDACGQCKSIALANNADLTIIDLKSKAIKIEDIRELIYKLSLKPYMAAFKVAIINDAQNLTMEAANALLKNLEEPKGGTVIVLVTSNSKALPSTIVSRLQKINFGLVRESEYQPLQVQKSETVRLLGLGKPGLIKRLTEDKEF